MICSDIRFPVRSRSSSETPPFTPNREFKSDPRVVVRADGRFEFDNVPSGDYTVTAGLNIGGYWNSASVAVHIDA